MSHPSADAARVIIECSLSDLLRPADPEYPLHLAIRLRAPSVERVRAHPLAVCAVLEGGGAMHGQPVADALHALDALADLLGPADEFALVTYGRAASVLVPLGMGDATRVAHSTVRDWEPHGPGDLAAGWIAGRDQLRRSTPDAARRLLLLTTGHHRDIGISAGRLACMVQDALAHDRIRTSALCLGRDADDDLLRLLTSTSLGNLHDGTMPALHRRILRGELEEIRPFLARNIRVTIDAAAVRSPDRACPSPIPLPGGGTEIAVGHLGREEETNLELALALKRAPEAPGSRPDPGRGIAPSRRHPIALEVRWEDPATGPRARRVTLPLPAPEHR